MEKPQWLTWAQEIQATAQAGLAYSENPFDRERYEKLRDLAVEMTAAHTDTDHNLVRDLFASGTGYQTPKVDIRAVVIRDDRILLVHEKADGKWALPGGWADVNLTAGQNAVKEVREESGVTAEARSLIAAWDRNSHVDDVFPYTVYKIFIDCAYVSGGFVENTETHDARFFALNDLPELSEGRNTKEQIQYCFAFDRSAPDKTAFD